LKKRSLPDERSFLMNTLVNIILQQNFFVIFEKIFSKNKNHKIFSKNKNAFVVHEQQN
jgi:hypothetical protein